MRTYICEIRTEQNNIYIKRDDLFPFSFGGNKARKAVNFFKEIDNGDFDWHTVKMRQKHCEEKRKRTGLFSQMINSKFSITMLKTAVMVDQMLISSVRRKHLNRLITAR